MSSHTTTHCWYWLDDTNWIPYSDPLVAQFESAFQAGSTKSIPVDKDRYIDINLTRNEIIKNFTSLTDPDLIGIQRRYDDPMKRRAVKRTKKSTQALIFKDMQFCFYSEKPKTKTQELKDLINSNGGTVKTSMTKKIDYLVFKPSDMKDDWKKFNDAIDSAIALKVTPVQANFINSSVYALKLLDDKSYLVDKQPVPVPVATPVATVTTTSPPKSIGQLSPKDSSYFVVGTEWAGVCTDENGEPYVFNMTVESFKDNQYHGCIQWVTLNSSVTKYKGTVGADHSFNFQEYEIVKGQDEVEVPSDYTSFIYGDTISGTVNDSKFRLKLSKSPSVSVMKPDSQWKGICTQHEKFFLSVTKRQDKEVEGTLTWPSFEDLVSVFKGTVEGTIIKVHTHTEPKNGPEINAPFDIVTTDNNNGTFGLSIKIQ
ncbi:BRCT domain-containing protein [Tieghemostelium lacteum]|uniref:BRCT domain-containing protein n=1 Tax=Tieghemostelium lacteum TaxID=361077 RepID=A0A151ZSL9_TIELA|nr:BRCT domain-containing protein [Tieghemostelium lacteum]|eukprot:KYQ96930.1 BRCT domain-containing protein [Tieghemostelium lacteum]